jgi:diacylglycerol kinase family enzyme
MPSTDAAWIAGRGTSLPRVPAPYLLVNPRSGDREPAPEELCRRAEALGVRAHVLRQGEDPAALAREADASALGVAGGDGSLGPVAAVAIERGLPFACIPFGTRNHFARDIGLDRSDPVGALGAFAGRERRVDVGRVGERVFLNNVSLGAYAQLVHRRERHRRRRVALANARALAIALRARPLRATVDGEPLDARILLVANNHYRLELLSLGERERLDDGLLHLYAAHGLLPRTWNERTGERFTIDVAEHAVDAAIDGEPARLQTPLEFRTRPLALRVLLPG